QQRYLLTYEYPWFLGRKMTLGFDLFYQDLAYQSPNSIYDEITYGGTVRLTRALAGRDNLIGSVHYTLENIGIHLNSGWGPANTPSDIIKEVGDHFLSRVGGSLAYDTRYGLRLPDKGQRTEMSAEFTGGPLGGDKEYYKLDFA